MPFGQPLSVANRLARLHRAVTAASSHMGIVCRRLTLESVAGTLREDLDLQAPNGTRMRVGARDAAGVFPIAPHELGGAKGLLGGIALKSDDGAIEARLVATELLRAGGRWDQRRRRWETDEAGRRLPATEGVVVVDVQESQLEAVRWAAERIAALRDRREHPESVALLYDDRRGGKSYICCVVMIAAALDVGELDGLPFEGWLVCQTQAARDELDVIIRSLLPQSWYTYRELPKRVYSLGNGSKIHCKTTDNPESLRVGKVDVVFLNEGALLPEAAYEIALRGTQDRAGFMVIATNRPRRAQGAWVARIADAADRELREGKRPACKVIRVPPSKNAAISQTAKSTIARAILMARDPDEGAELDESLILEAGDFAYSPPFDEAKHRLGAPFGFDDITMDVTRELCGRPYQHIVGADFQRQCAAVVFKIMRRDDQWYMWAVSGYFFADGGDENDLIEALTTGGFNPGNTLVCGDCSGAWQKGDHGYGPVSFVPFEKAGYHITTPTKKKTADAKFAKNPDVCQSVAKLRKLIADGRFFVHPDAPGVAIAMRKCAARKDAYGNLRPRGIHAHIGDCCRYVAWYLLSRNATASPAALPSYVGRGRR